MASQKVDVTTAHRVETPRLILRLHRLSDAADLAALFKNPANVVYSPEHDPPSEITESAYLAKIKSFLSKAAAGEQALWIFSLKNPDGSEGPVMGCGGFPWLPVNAAGRAGNTGVLIDSAYSRKGYGTEAIIATLDYGFDVLGFEKIEQNTADINGPYRGLMKSVGLEPFGKKLENENEAAEWEYIVTKSQWKEVKANIFVK